MCLPRHPECADIAQQPDADRPRHEQESDRSERRDPGKAPGRPERRDEGRDLSDRLPAMPQSKQPREYDIDEGEGEGDRQTAQAEGPAGPVPQGLQPVTQTPEVDIRDGIFELSGELRVEDPDEGGLGFRRDLSGQPVFERGNPGLERRDIALLLPAQSERHVLYRKVQRGGEFLRRCRRDAGQPAILERRDVGLAIGVAECGCRQRLLAQRHIFAPGPDLPTERLRLVLAHTANG